MNQLQQTQDLFTKVTGREIQIIRHFAEGRNTREIATLLGISMNTVEVHRHNIMKKTGFKNAAHVVAEFIRAAVI